MARWQLTEPHYLNVPGNVWEQQTQDRTTGRTVRKTFPVPMHLDPNYESDWNYREMVGTNIIDGKIIVCHPDKGEPKDIIFVGPPTPGMLPLDAEAKALSSKITVPLTKGLDEISQAEGWQQQLLISLTDMKNQVTAAPKIEGMAEFMKAMADMMALQTKLLAALVEKGAQPVDAEPPLEDAAEPTDEEIAASAQIADSRKAQQSQNDQKIREGFRRI
jgi:hypothetical protein